MYYGQDVDAALAFVGRFANVREALNRSGPRAAGTILARLRAALEPWTTERGVWIGSRAWIVTARRAQSLPRLGASRRDGPKRITRRDGDEPVLSDVMAWSMTVADVLEHARSTSRTSDRLGLVGDSCSTSDPFALGGAGDHQVKQSRSS